MANANAVVIFGGSGSGKATVANAMFGKEIFETEESQARPNRIRISKSFHSEDTAHTNIYIVNLSGDINELIQEFQSECCDEEVFRFILVVEKTRITQNLENAFSAVINHLKAIDRKSALITALVVTHCESQNEEAQKAIRQSLPRTLTNFAKQGVTLVAFHPKGESIFEDEFEKERKRSAEDLKKLLKTPSVIITRELRPSTGHETISTDSNEQLTPSEQSEDNDSETEDAKSGNWHRQQLQGAITKQPRSASYPPSSESPEDTKPGCKERCNCIW